MKYNFENRNEYEKALEQLRLLLLSQSKVEIKRVTKKRSLKQNSYLHLILTWIGLELGYTLDETKDVFKLKFLSYKKNNFTFMKQTSKLKTDEMTIFIDQIRNYCSKNLNMYIPAPNEQGLLEAMQNDINANKQYL